MTKRKNSDIEMENLFSSDSDLDSSDSDCSDSNSSNANEPNKKRIMVVHDSGTFVLNPNVPKLVDWLRHPHFGYDKNHIMPEDIIEILDDLVAEEKGFRGVYKFLAPEGEELRRLKETLDLDVDPHDTTCVYLTKRPYTKVEQALDTLMAHAEALQSMVNADARSVLNSVPIRVKQYAQSDILCYDYEDGVHNLHRQLINLRYLLNSLSKTHQNLFTFGPLLQNMLTEEQNNVGDMVCPS